MESVAPSSTLHDASREFVHDPWSGRPSDLAAKQALETVQSFFPIASCTFELCLQDESHHLAALDDVSLPLRLLYTAFLAKVPWLKVSVALVLSPAH